MVCPRRSYSPVYAYRQAPDLADSEYWKLNAEDIESARAERGFLDYSQCSLDELSRFCQQRGAVPPRGQYATFARFRRKLQEADEAAMVNGFLDLPPELRLRIYELYKDTLDFGHFSIAPPITAVSKLVRRESISVFFRERLFLTHRERDWPLQSDMTLQVVTSLFFGRAPQSFNHSLRRLEIMVPLGHGTGYAEFEIDLSARERERRAFFVSMGTFGWAPWSEHRQEVALTVDTVLA